jgi:hypothetical protein
VNLNIELNNIYDSKYCQIKINSKHTSYFWPFTTFLSRKFAVYKKNHFLLKKIESKVKIYSHGEKMRFEL